MFQLKISAAIFIVVLALMGFAYYALTDSVTESIVRNEAVELSLARRAVSDVRRTAELSLREMVRPAASDPVVVRELEKLRDLAKNTRTQSELNKVMKSQENRDPLLTHLFNWRRTYEAELKDRLNPVASGNPTELHEAGLRRPLADWWGEEPDLLLAFVALPLKRNRTGHVLVAHVEKGQELRAGRDFRKDLPVLSRAEEAQTPQVDVIKWKTEEGPVEYLAVAGPVFDAEGFMIGTVVAGFPLGAELVDRFASVTGGNNSVIVYSGESRYSDSAKIKDLLPGAVFHPVSVTESSADFDTATEVELTDLEPEQTYLTELEGVRYLLQRRDWLSGEESKPRVGFYVLSDFEAAVQPVDDLRYQGLPLVGAVLLIVALIITLAIIRRFLKPIEDIDVGIQEILAGNKEYIFRASGNPLHCELVNSLNQLTAFLQGKAGPGEAEVEWDELLVDLEPERPSIYGMQAVMPVADASEREKLKNLYEEYMARRKELNQHVDMDFDRFCRRIKRNETSLKEKHDCKAIEFSVAIADGKVVLKPQPIF